MTACDGGKGSDTGSWDTRPNLLVAGFLYEAAADGYQFTVIIENDGGVAADTFAVDLFLDRSTRPRVGDPSDATAMVNSGVPSGETVSATLSVSSACDGCKSWVLVDATDLVGEADESDNYSGPMELLRK